MKLIILFYLPFILLGCSQNEKKRPIIINKNLFSIADTIINPNGEKLNDSSIIKLYLSDSARKIKERVFIKSEVSIGIYLMILLDGGFYEPASVIAEKYQPSNFQYFYFKNIPQFSYKKDNYLKLALLRYFQFCKGLNPNEVEEMYRLNLLTTIEKNSAKLLLEAEYFSSIIINSSKDFQGDNFLKFSKIKERFPYLKRLKLLDILLKYKKNETSKNEIENYLIAYNEINFEFEYFIKSLMYINYQSELYDKNLQKRLIHEYSSRYNFCNIYFMRYYNAETVGYNNECIKCIDGPNGLNSLIALADQTLYYLDLKKLDSVKNNLGKYQFIKNSNYENDKIEEVRKIQNIFSLLNLRFLLLKKEYNLFLKSYINVYGGTEKYTHFQFSDLLRKRVKMFYLLDINKDSTGFNNYFILNFPEEKFYSSRK